MACDLKGKTGNPICSDDLADLKDNTILMDQYINSAEFVVSDRLGVERKTWAGIEKDAQDNINGFEDLINDKIIAQGGTQVLNDWVRLNDAPLSAEFIMDNLGYVTPEMFGAVGDGVTDDNYAVFQAVDKAVERGVLVVANGNYIVSDAFNPARDNIVGAGSFVYSTGKSWMVANKGEHENVFYVGGNSTTASGMSPSQSISLRTAIDRIRDLGGVLDGEWVIQFKEGTHKFNGIRLYNMPLFIRFLTFKGVDVEYNTEPKSIWDGTDSSKPYALLGQNPQSIPYRFRFENLNIINWYKDNKTNSGFCVLWQQATVYTRNLWFDNVSFGMSIRQGYMQCLGGRAYRSRLPYNVAYNAVGNFGSLNPADGILIEDCDRGVENGRNSVMYVQNVHFKRCGVDIISTRLSRFRSQACTHEEWRDHAYIVQLNSVQTPDNGAGYPDTFIHSDSYKPVLRLASGSTHLHVNTGMGTTNTTSNGTVEVPTNLTTKTILSELIEDINIAATWSPFRVPFYFLNTVGACIRVTFTLRNYGNVEGTLALHGLGSGNRVQLTPEIKVLKEQTTYQVELEVSNIGAGILFGITRVGGRITSREYNFDSGFSRLQEQILIGRIYVTTDESSERDAWQLINLRTEVSM